MDELDKILQLLKKGDRRGLELLFHHFYKPLVFYAMNFLAQQEEAEDAVQEVFIKFWEGKRFHAIKNSLRPYLYQSVRNYCWKEKKWFLRNLSTRAWIWQRMNIWMSRNGIPVLINYIKR